jgi:hypothetical protein
MEKHGNEMNQSTINEILVEVLEHLTDAIIGKNVMPWKELNEAYIKSEGSFKGTKFEENKKIQAIFRGQLSIDTLTEEFEKDD